MAFKIYHKSIPQIINEDIIETQIRSLPILLQNRINNYSNLFKKNQRIIGLTLLDEVLKNHPSISINYNLENLKFSASGKPYLDDFIDFNLTYCSDYVVLAIGLGNKVGIDIEKINPQNIELFKDYFTKEEWTLLINANEPHKQFYWFWTRKEALSKAVGKGVTIDYNTLDVVNDNPTLYGKKWKIETILFEKKYYLSTVCSL